MIYKYPQFPHVQVLGVLATNVKNIDTIKQAVISLDQRYDYCFINAANVVSVEQINCAIFKTLTNYYFNEKKPLRTNSVHAETILNLSPNANITDSLNRFGISKGSANLIILKVYGLGGPQQRQQENESLLPDDAAKDLQGVIQRDLQNIKDVVEAEVAELDNDEQLVGISDLKLIKKNYKLGDMMVEDREVLSRLLVSVLQLSDL
ncbi:Cgi121 protein [Saccharomycopsis crataegensis]|uniref:EKC/KEOPS complex subunit CGI121 n=1 Tax=Saccharomycopsis crataegensis TaxID=43959 RepID=A0AAV5QGX9_9ASCO|nr:Cgi121 protein [Saccharomycopsis crataegensis]